MHIYSNHSFATLGQVVEDVSGEPLHRYFRGHIFEPLGMEQTDLLRSERVRGRLAMEYAVRSHGPRPIRDCDLITAGSGGNYSTARDMARYVAALLGGGANERGSVLKPETLAAMFSPQYQPDPRLPGVGLAFYRRDVGGHLIVEKDGLVRRGMPKYRAASATVYRGTVNRSSFGASTSPPRLGRSAGYRWSAFDRLAVEGLLVRTRVRAYPALPTPPP